MFYEASSLDRILICLNCLQRFDKPKLLPCGESICESCLLKLPSTANTNVLCPYCKIYHESSSTFGFPTEKIVAELLQLKPVKVYRGQSILEIEAYLSESKANIQTLMTTLANKIKIINVNSSQLREQVKNNSLCHKIDQYKVECYNNYKNYFSPFNTNFHDEYFKVFCAKITKNLRFLQAYLAIGDLNETKLNYLRNLVTYLSINIKINQNYLNSILFNRKILLLKNDKIEYRLYYDYGDILSIPRLKELSWSADRVIDYKNNSCFNNEYMLQLKIEVKNVWLSIFYNNYLIIYLQIFNHVTNKMEIHIKLTNSNGELIRERCVNETIDDNLHLISLTNTNISHLESNFFMIATESVKNENIIEFELLLFNLNLKLIKKVRLNHKPVYLYCSEMYIYVLTKKIPFIQQLNFSPDDEINLLEENKAFGQNKDCNKPYFMSNKIIQLSSKYNDELLYVCFDNSDNEEEEDRNLIKIFSTKTNKLIRKININLNNCFVYIDSLLRMIIVDKAKRILNIYTEVLFNDSQLDECELEFDGFQNNSKIDTVFSEAIQNKVFLNLIYECNLEFINGNITNFCVANGHLLINDSSNKIIYIL